MHPEVEEQKQKIKEILYDCAVEIRATKAALYLSASLDLRLEGLALRDHAGEILRSQTGRDPRLEDLMARHYEHLRGCLPAAAKR